MKLKKHLLEDIAEAKRSIEKDRKLLSKMKKTNVGIPAQVAKCQCKKKDHG